MIEPGKVLGPFRIEHAIGSGAMGTVFRAVYSETGKPVAIKVIAMGLLVNESARARFEREGEILKQLRHPHIVRLFATGHYKKTPFIAMEYVEGESLDVALERRGRLTWEEVVRLGKQLCLALQHAHEKGIIHRDLKPSNLMILKDGTLKLTDFGIAKDTDVTALTGNNSTVGTAAYMSPEQCRGERNLTAKSDIYSLGVVFYELLTGEKPFDKESPVDMFLAHVNDPFERPSRKVLEIPPWLDTLVCQMLEKRPEHRPIDAAMVGKALDEVLEKIGEQRSAGLDFATARSIDRKVINTDEADREAARALRGGTAKKKYRKRGPRFYEKGWFVALSALAILAGIGGLSYWAFSAPNPEKLYRRAELALQSGAKERAREHLIRFHNAYPNRDDEQAQQMQEWLEAIEVDSLENGLHNRFRRKMESEHEPWKTAYAALTAENDGRFTDAQLNWKNLAERYGDAKSIEDQAWTWLCRKKLADLAGLSKVEADLKASLAQSEYKFGSDSERRSAEALRFEMFGDWPAAFDRWTKIREEYLPHLDSRPYVLLAVDKIRKPRDVTGDEPTRAFRIDLITRKLNEVELLMKEPVKKNMRTAHDICRDIQALYEQDGDPALTPLVQRATTRMKEIPRPPEPNKAQP